MLSNNVLRFLVDEGVLSGLGEDAFVGELPDSDGSVFTNAVAISDTTGVEPDRYLPLKQRTIQVLVRNDSQADAHDVAYLIYDKLHNTVPNIPDEVVMNSFALQEPSFLGFDDSGRTLFVCNYVLRVRND